MAVLGALTLITIVTVLGTFLGGAMLMFFTAWSAEYLGVGAAIGYWPSVLGYILLALLFVTLGAVGGKSS